MLGKFLQFFSISNKNIKKHTLSIVGCSNGDKELNLGGWQIFMIFDSYLPNVGSFLLLIRRQIWTIFDPSLPKTC